MKARAEVAPPKPGTVQRTPKRLRARTRRRMKQTSGLGRRWIGRLQSGQTVTPDAPGADRLLIWLDGKPQDLAVAFNAREGWVERVIRGPDGRVIANEAGDAAKVERVYGKVALKMLPVERPS